MYERNHLAIEYGVLGKLGVKVPTKVFILAILHLLLDN